MRQQSAADRSASWTLDYFAAFADLGGTTFLNDNVDTAFIAAILSVDGGVFRFSTSNCLALRAFAFARRSACLSSLRPSARSTCLEIISIPIQFDVGAAGFRLVNGNPLGHQAAPRQTVFLQLEAARLIVSGSREALLFGLCFSDIGVSAIIRPISLSHAWAASALTRRRRQVFECEAGTGLRQPSLCVVQTRALLLADRRLATMCRRHCGASA